MLYAIGYLAVAALLARFYAPRERRKEDAESTAVFMIVWPVTLLAKFLMWLARRGWERR